MSNWKATADLYEALIERPKMTEKLLAKPPFKYIFDIITETTKKTGFGNGIYLLIKDSMKGMSSRLTFTARRIEKLLTYRRLLAWSK